MHVLFLGTGAADWNPAEASADPEFRRLTAALADRKILIDCGPCIHEFEKTFGYEGLYRGVRDILFTHSHPDHFNAASLARVCDEADGPVTVHGHAAIAPLLPQNDKLIFKPVTLLEPFVMQDGAYQVTALPANHSTEIKEEQPLHYILTKQPEDKTLFWGCDGAWLVNAAYHVIRKTRFDAMVFDCTVGESRNDYRLFEHNSIWMVEEMKRSLLESHHVMKEGGACYVCHMARTLHTDHETLRRRLQPSGIVPARDNMEIII